MGQIQIHVKYQAVRTAEPCTSAFFSEAHAECSGLVGRQPIILNIYKTNLIFSSLLEITRSIKLNQL